MLVTAAAAVRLTNGSSVWKYSGGSSAPPRQGERRLVGMWVCSGTKRASNPRSSNAGASSVSAMQ